MDAIRIESEARLSLPQSHWPMAMVLVLYKQNWTGNTYKE